MGGGEPVVTDTFETEVPGLYTVGMSAMHAFGPLLSFMVGAEFVAPRVAAHLARKVSSISRRAA